MKETNFCPDIVYFKNQYARSHLLCMRF